MAFLLSDSVSVLKGVGPAREKALAKEKIHTLSDLIFLFPKDYRVLRVLPISEENCGVFGVFLLSVDSAPGLYSSAGRKIVRFSASDEDGGKVIILYPHQPYLIRQIQRGDKAYFAGTLTQKNGRLYLFSPKRYKDAPEDGKVIPVYPSVGGLSSEATGKLIAQCLPYLLDQIKDPIPPALIPARMPPRNKALFLLHAPVTIEDAHRAAERFSFEEWFAYFVRAHLFNKKTKTARVPGFDKADLSPFLKALPFSLTPAQKRVIEEIKNDLVAPKQMIPPMDRLLQGDVGSGKTIVCAAAIYLTFQNHYSSLLMAPTEILAQQHYRTLSRLFEPLGLPVYLLTGSTTKKERTEIFSHTQSDAPYLLIGTHALTEDSAKCAGVALAITDEQHRFGVRQRNLLANKGRATHSLVMSATPIPRSLAMFLFSGSHISVIDTLPPGRKEIETFYVGEDKIDRVYAFIRERVQCGEQAYLVCPLIEDENKNSPLNSAKDEFLSIDQKLPEIPKALLHGRMKNDEKKRVMDAFVAGEIKILVSTTVIEVGVDVPRATVMCVRSAERFGLSQLHQLRGRVGRGGDKSYCILLSSHPGKAARERLKKLCDCHDGFELAKYDLKTRGPGEFFGTRQSGFDLDLNLGATSMELMKEAQTLAETFVNTAPSEALAPYENKMRLN